MAGPEYVDHSTTERHGQVDAGICLILIADINLKSRARFNDLSNR